MHNFEGELVTVCSNGYLWNRDNIHARPALGPIQPPTQWVPGALFPTQKAARA